MATDVTEYARAGADALLSAQELANAKSPHCWSSPADMAWRAGRFMRQRFEAMPHDIARASMGRGDSVNVWFGAVRWRVALDYRRDGQVLPRFAD